MPTTHPSTAVPRDSEPGLRDRMVPPMPSPAWLGWLAATLVALFAGVLRFYRLGAPAQIYFDETYYAKDAFGLRSFGVEHETVENADEMLRNHNLEIWTGSGDFVVHPPGGKWMIAAFDWLWGLLPFATSMTPFSWRIAAAVFGTLSVLLLVLVALRMTRSVLLASAAGLLMALDGLHFTMSRIAMVDIFLTFWILAGFACLVMDRERARARLADLTERGYTAAGWLGMRWWRIGAGLCLGMACATKWSALFYVAAFGLLTVAWDYGARRTVGQRRMELRWLRLDAVPAFFSTVGVGAVVYVVSWTGWFLSSIGPYRDWASQPENQTGIWGLLPGPVHAVVAPLRSLLHYHQEIMGFHTGLSSPHDYASAPWEWPIMRTPVAFYYTGEDLQCGAPTCSSAILNVGTPAVWWISILAVVVMLGWLAIYRDWRAGAVLLGAAAGWLPWFAFPDRTMFVFYALPMLPFLVLAIVLMLGLLIGPGIDDPAFLISRRVVGAMVFGSVLLLTVANFAYMYPVWTAEIVPHDVWADRMWFETWIYGNASPD